MLFYRCVLVLIATATVAQGEEHLLFDFEGKDFAGWTVEGKAFGERPITGESRNLHGHRGQRVVGSYHGGDAPTGSLTSDPFEITQDHLAFLIGGGRHDNETGIELLVEGKSVRSATGHDSADFRWHSWDVRELRGKKAQLRIFDRARGGWGHINVDHIMLTDKPRSGPAALRIEEYRKSDDYYREPFRPQFHFSPEVNWTNDPNGMVFYKGEYHLFYQANPHGNTWGHMSWGHAVSRDLVHWEHLPIALHDEFGTMIFSGSAVVDWKNTTGFGKDGEPPLVAIYTGHGHGKQTQDLAYSNDRGRTWTKYEGNPVLDIGSNEFRDPKVFWHEPTKQWVMIVALANEKKVRFYASKDLKAWSHLSDFGPAGAKSKPNWECPDMFELPIEGEPGQTRWLLEANIGSGSIAGGSGCEYFVGQFDGKQFTNEAPKDQVNWIDYGRDFYAVVSWSDVPKADGRRIWLAWMNNWETSGQPTYPWRGAMTLPRSLTLRRTADGLRLYQTPVKELESLRNEHVHAADLTITGDTATIDYKQIAGDKLEIIAEFKPGDATEFGLKVRKSGAEETIVGYDVAKQELFVDRTKSGNVDFHDKFAGRHAAPLPLENGRIRLHIFVDVSSVEVFGNDGRISITDSIFPNAKSQGLELYSKGGSAEVLSFDVWHLKSAWHK